MRKQITSLLLTLAMLLSLVPTLGVTASAGEMLPPLEVGTYQELRSAILSGKSRIKLKNDINTRWRWKLWSEVGLAFLRSTESWKSKIPALVKPEKSPGNSHPIWPQCSVWARAAAG